MKPGAITIAGCPMDPLRVVCSKCGRAGRYRLATLRQRFGADAALPDVLGELAACTRRRNSSDPCGARFPDLAPSTT